MSRFNLSDIQSSTLIYATDSLDEMFGVVQTLIQTNGLDALVGFTLSVQSPIQMNSLRLKTKRSRLCCNRERHTDRLWLPNSRSTES